MREPKENRLFLAIVLVYMVVVGLINGLAAAGVAIRLPLVLQLTLGELTLVVPTLLYVAICRPSLRGLSERWRLPVAVIPLLILMAYSIMPLISVVNLVSMMLAGENAAASMLGTLQQLPMGISFLCVAVLPGVVEEFIFRGLLYGEYRRRRTWGAILTSALLFGLMHMNLNQFCYAFLIGILFCMVYEATGSLLAPMLMHTVYNGNSVIMTYLMDNGAAGDMSAEASAQMLEQMLDGGFWQHTMLFSVIVLLIVGLIGLAVAGGLYVAVTKLCHREQQVLLMFQRDSWKKRQAWMPDRRSTEDRVPIEGDLMGSRKIWGPVLWTGVILSMGVILLGVWSAQFA